MAKRVAVMVEQFWHRVPGGTARATYETLRALNGLQRFDLIGVAASHRRASQPSFESPIAVRNAKLPRPVLYDSWHRLGFPGVEQITGPVDAFWASAMVVPPPTVPIITTVHDLDFLHHPERLSRRGKSFFPQSWEAAKERSTLMVCPSQVVAEACQAEGVDEARLRVVPWGVTPQPVDPDEVEAALVRLGVPDRYVLWVGTLEPRKNLPGLVAALEDHDDMTLVVAGPDGWELDGDGVLDPLGNRCLRVGKVSDSDLRCLYSGATVFALPSFAEGFGLPVLEAMSHGTPVVTSRGTATEEVACDAALLVDPNSAHELGQALHSVWSDAELAGQLGARGRAQAEQCSWQASAAAYADIFDEATEMGTR